MGIKSVLARPFAAWISKQIKLDAQRAVQHQQQLFRKLITKAAKTRFGQDHGFETIRTYTDFKHAVPVRDYEALRPYLDAIAKGEANVCWPGKPVYLAKTSGTTSGTKYIPITADSIPYHIRSARNALLCYIAETGNAEFVDGNLIFLSGSPQLTKQNGILTGRLSGIVNHHVPAYLRGNQMPSFETNCIEDWEQKVDAIVAETRNKPMTLISGIPPWVQMYFDKLSAASSGALIKDIFPAFQVMVYGGVNYEPYRARMEATIGKRVDSIETYPASEGFIAYQDTQTEEGLLLLTNNGIYFEFIPVETFFSENPIRLSLQEVKLNQNYVLVLNTNAGLFGYNIGDTVRFVSLMPYRIVVTGRIKHFISAFGEHVIGEEVEFALLQTAKQFGVSITEFTVAPQVNPSQGLPHHEWFVEFENKPSNMHAFIEEVDKALQQKNVYYKDLITGGVLRTLVMHSMPKDTFIQYMKQAGKLGGQNKVPRLSNDRSLADALLTFMA